jgi:hypothetical protein
VMTLDAPARWSPEQDRERHAFLNSVVASRAPSPPLQNTR